MGKKEVKAVKEVKDVIANSINKGVSKSEIRKSLSNLGFDEKIIDIELGKIKEKKQKKEKEKKRFHTGTIIKFENVNKSFKDNDVLRNINFEIDQGDLFGIIGLSGSGKTTILNILIGFIEPEKGDVKIKLYEKSDYESVFKNRKDIENYFGFASQESSFYKKLTAEENLLHFASLYGLRKSDAQKRAKELLDLMELSDSNKTLAGDLSGGMQKRLDIACSMIHSPKVLILDEPTADLDPFLRREMMGLVKKINEQGTTIIIASHFLQEIEHLCNRIAILHNKTVVKVCTSENLGEMYRKEEEIHIETTPGNYSRIEKSISGKRLIIKKVVIKDHKLIVHTSNAGDVLDGLIKIIEHSKEKIVNIKIEKPDLRDIFEDIITKTKK
ncbi:MAG: ABC transporter ATP-binding protein [Candidatus Woesearchaeota archaeon]